MSRKAVFMDKDGTLVHDVPYNVNPARITLYPEAGEALMRLQQAGYLLVVISNQSGVARGYFEEEALAGVQNRLQELLHPYRVRLNGFFYCPHHPDGPVAAYAIECNCRKPMPGMITRAARQLGVSLVDSWMVGDILNDIEAGNRAGCRTLLIEVGNETEWVPGDYREPDFTVNNWTEAADRILLNRMA